MSTTSPPSSLRRAASAFFALLSILLPLAGSCSSKDEGYIALPPLLPARSAASDDGIVVPEGALTCESDADCDDGIDCTRDTCVQETYCQFSPVRSRCQDELFCNGEEWCDPDMGCVPGVEPSCNDRDVCTVDSCDESIHGCRFALRDFDGDGEADWHCSGGTDCDDFDPTRNGGAPELCGDFRDNDCDEAIDELDCGSPEHDTCEDALELQAGVTAELQLSGAGFNYPLSCAEIAQPDVVATFELDEPKDVQLTARGLLSNGNEELISMAVRRSCEDAASEFECANSGFPARVRMRSLPAGRYFVLLAPGPRINTASTVEVTMEFGDPTPEPSNASCGAALDISAGGRFEGSFVDVPDSLRSACAAPSPSLDEPYHQPDLYYRFITTEPQDVQLSAVTKTGEAIGVAIASACGELSAPRHCERDEPVSFVLHELPAGTYFVQVESPVAVEADFELDLRFSPPTSAPAGDECTGAEVLAVDGGRVTADLRSKLSKVAVSCSQLPTAPDHVFRLAVEQPTDLLIDADMGGAEGVVALQQGCGDVDREQLCRLVSQQQEYRIRNVEPGLYFLVVESADAAEVNVTVTTAERTTPTYISGNDSCSQLTEVTAAGGLFVGDTSMLTDNFSGCKDSGAPDAIYRLTLEEPSASVKVTVRPAFNFDAMLYRYNAADPIQGDPCASTAGQPRCTGSGTLEVDVLNEALEAGTYYYIIDGFESQDQGPYEVEFEIQ